VRGGRRDRTGHRGPATIRGVAVKAKQLRYAVELGPGDVLRSEDGTPLEPAESWSPEHLLLAALARCTLKSLRFHARRANIGVTLTAGSASSLVTRREDDGRYAVVEANVALAVELEPAPDGPELGELLAKAERDCFVGASLRAKPTYRWTVNGTAGPEQPT
jgi:organic hydroperoxide reductase OsmC/OhrA